MKYAWCALVVAMAVMPPASAGPLEDGNAAYARGDFAAALRLLTVAGERGGAPQALTTIGMMYEQGQGVRLSATEALKWYRRAADAGYGPAIVNLALIYSGFGGTTGIPANLPEAAKWLRVGADLGYAPAQAMLGFAYVNGRGVAADPVEAKKWLTLAAERLPTGRERDEAIRNRDTLAARLSPAQNQAVREAALRWRPKGAEPDAGEAPPVAPVPAAAVTPAPPPPAAPVVQRATVAPPSPPPAPAVQPVSAPSGEASPPERSGAKFVDTLDLEH